MLIRQEVFLSLVVKRVWGGNKRVSQDVEVPLCTSWLVAVGLMDSENLIDSNSFVWLFSNKHFVNSILPVASTFLGDFFSEG